MSDMCDFCGEDSTALYPFDPEGEINICKECDGFFGPQAREVAFKVKNNINNNIIRFLDENYLFVNPEMKAWIIERYTKISKE